ncbi:ring-1,2-phenylacetyl-CoA epoxidase subunit PaaC [Pseudarthrobacter enclensis]|uniref:Phenylacetic acid degradation protein n=1 Tax=Pseudarthrobacter enclensis TaxID=993070 RepID=A0A0V8I5L6_9MICC|nr:1,2-phenylacetyl-CoA epoxidase subunit PaaC [Pseudarthrobacter enclensis]KSU70004.1 hypothetical protein AS031_18275 [Pseudarthrobacter enclensis]SCC30038.1 ring-1,2-phenylacetyl-CoA epoxidase subunit PaaC [Pseudarthrobacter enclensis]
MTVEDPRTTAVTGLGHYVLGLGDDALVLSERCAELITRSPTIEEDLAISNIALDLLGQARGLLAHAGELEGAGRSEDDLAYLRLDTQFRNCALAEVPNGDFAFVMLRIYLLSEYFILRYAALADSADSQLSAISAKALKEVSYHKLHARDWVIRLGRGTAESAKRAQAALADAEPYFDELFDDTWIHPDLITAGIAVSEAALRDQWQAALDKTLSEADLELPGASRPFSGARHGRHTEHLGNLLALTQSLHRAHPGASW